MKPKIIQTINAALLIILGIITLNCNNKPIATVDEVITDFYFSISEGDYEKTNARYIAGWDTRQDFEKQIITEFQGEIQKIFDQHGGLKEVKVISNTPGENEAEATLDIQLICDDGYIESVTLNMVQEEETWKVKE